jgi:hypothetical protein
LHGKNFTKEDDRKGGCEMISEHEDLRGYPMFKFLYESWQRFRQKGMLSEEWAEFRVYYEWAMERGYKPGARIVRWDKRNTASPGNCYLDFPGTEETEHIKGGYKNSPCISCRYDTGKGCVCYRSCKRYILWLNKCWEDFREAAYIRESEVDDG